MKNVEIITMYTNSIIINAQDTTLAGLQIPFIVMEINSPTAGISTGSYIIPGNSSDAYTSITYSKNLSLYQAKASISGSSASISIITLTPHLIKGTFTATLVPQANASGLNVNLTNGVFNCNY
jgi:hypothetical protein